LARLLRQLRFRWEDFALSPQVGSSIMFPTVELRFDNDFELLRSEIRRVFPTEIDNFQHLMARMADYDELDQVYDLSTRDVLRETIDDPLLAEMILCPLMWYGNARERDMDFGQFCVLFRSIFLEGLARPLPGVRLILKNLVRRFRELGGELRLRCGVDRICTDGDRAVGVVLDDGTEIQARRILSSAGWVETMRMCDFASHAALPEGGRMSFAESISILDVKPEALGHHRTMVFFNDSQTLHWERCDGLCDVRTGVICSPNNFLYAEGESTSNSLPDGVIRISSIANFQDWVSLAPEQYALAKLYWYDRVAASAVRFMPDFRAHVIDTDMFTPKTVRRFTWHENGAVYGAPHKQLDGTTHLKNVFICGADQGFVGIIGTIMSGIAMANRHCLREQG
jgi:phytoene dehydrogenase-like protein